MEKEWKNWSGSLKFSPNYFDESKKDESKLIALIQKASQENRKLRVVGAGHSSSPLVKTDDVLISLSRQKKILNINQNKRLVTMQAGISIQEAGNELLKSGLSMHNTGDVDVQTVVGALATGTHGTGKYLQNLSTMLYGVKLVNGKGEIIETDEEKDPDFMRAIRVNLGTMGIYTEVTLKLLPAFRLVRKEYFTDTRTCLENWDEVSERNRNCDFYWYPRNDMVKIRTMNLPGEDMDLPFACLVEEKAGWGMHILPKSRDLKFDEMEYSIPSELAIECFLKIRARVKKKHREKVAWRILFRTVKADDNYLSTAYKRDSVCISLHHNAGLPYDDYFNDIELIFKEYGGRPHWGKKHNLKARELYKLYPEWANFHKYRKSMDPSNVFITPYLEELLLNY